MMCCVSFSNYFSIHSKIFMRFRVSKRCGARAFGHIEPATLASSLSRFGRVMHFGYITNVGLCRRAYIIAYTCCSKIACVRFVNYA